MNRAERERYGKETERINRRFEAIFFPKVKAAIRSKVLEVIKIVKEKGITAAQHHLHLDLSNIALSNTVSEIYKYCGVKAAQRVTVQLKKEPGKKYFLFQMDHKRLSFNPAWIRMIQELLGRFLLQKITFEVNATTRNRILGILQMAIDKGFGVDETVRLLEGSPLSERQAAVIVRTEIKRATETGGSVAAETFPFEQNKEWIAIKDNRTRGNPINGSHDHANHWEMDGQVVDADGKFKDPRNGNELKYPGDPEGEAEDTIQCRCTVGYEAKRDDRGRMIPKKTSEVRIIDNRVTA